MARPRTLNDPVEVKTIIDTFLANPKPTLGGLARALKIHPDTLYRNMDREDDIGDMLYDAYLYMVQKHEEGLYDKSGVTGHIFWLHCCKKYIRFQENDTPETNNAVNLTFTVVDKDEHTTK